MFAKKAVTTVGRVWQRAFLDALVSPRQFRRTMPELRRTCDSLFHPGIADIGPWEVPGSDAVQILPMDRGYGGMPVQDLYATLRVAQWVKAAKIFEIGTFNGRTTAHLAVNTPAEIYTLDLPRDLAADLHDYNEEDQELVRSRDQIGTCYRGHNEDGRIQQLFGDSRTFDYGPYAGAMDLVIVDACHLYEFVVSDSRHAFDLLGDSGAVLWHDFANSLDVTTAVCELAAQHTIFHIEGTWLALYVRGERLKQELLARGNGAVRH
jgi:hypothetical protein